MQEICHAKSDNSFEIGILVLSIAHTYVEALYFCSDALLVEKYDVTGFSKWLTHWGRVTHICITKLTIIGSDNGLPPGRRQAIIWNNTGILLSEPIGTNFNEISIDIDTFSFKEMHLKNSSEILSRPQCVNDISGNNTYRILFRFRHCSYCKGFIIHQHPNHVFAV